MFKSRKYKEFMRKHNPFISKNDPIYWCDYYIDKDCSYVDGMLCDYPDCYINDKYISDINLYILTNPDVDFLIGEGALNDWSSL